MLTVSFQGSKSTVVDAFYDISACSGLYSWGGGLLFSHAHNASLTCQEHSPPTGPTACGLLLPPLFQNILQPKQLKDGFSHSPIVAVISI